MAFSLVPGVGPRGMPRAGSRLGAGAGLKTGVWEKEQDFRAEVPGGLIETGAAVLMQLVGGVWIERMNVHVFSPLAL